MSNFEYSNSAFDNMEEIPLPTYKETPIEEISNEITTELSTSFHGEVTTTERRTVISTQPGLTTTTETTSTRRPIPISIINRDSFQSTFQSPSNGLDFMRNVDQLIIQQNVNLTDVIADTENRYTVKIPSRENSEAIYYATESSSSCQRMVFGSGRAFDMKLYDKTDQEAMFLTRRLACGYCTFCCHLQRIEVWVPPGELVGIISQRFKPFRTSFEVKNRHEQVLYIIEGSTSFACFHNGEMFQIYTSDGSTQIGTIVHQWDPVSVRYQLLLQMPSSITDNRHKALLLGAAFLVEYMFFERADKRMGLGCFC